MATECGHARSGLPSVVSVVAEREQGHDKVASSFSQWGSSGLGVSMAFD